MIVCHCNVLCSDRIATEVRRAVKHTPPAAITAEQIYAACQCAPNCGGCQDVVRQIIRRVTEDLACAV